MTECIIDINFSKNFASGSKIKGRLVSGQRFSGTVHMCATDYFTIVELKIEGKDGNLVEEDTDITKMRYDSIMFFDRANNKNPFS
jgi:hypothetical protein